MNTRKPLFALALAALFVSLASWFILSKLGSAAENHSQGSEWTLVVDGIVSNPLNLTDSEIRAMPKTTVYAELYCVDNPGLALARGNWSGVKLGFLLGEARVLSSAIKVAFHANDGYSSDLPLTTAMREDVIVAYDLNGQPLPEKLRLVVPGKWGYKWVSQLIRIELVNYDFKGTWESRGYSDEADIHPPALLPTDLNKDGRIDSQDMKAVAAAFGSRPGNPKWNEVTDLDKNGQINIIDVARIAKDYGRTSL